MGTWLNSTSSKWAVYEPRWDGDLLSNLGGYPVVPHDPKKLDAYWKTLITNAEEFAGGISRTNGGHNISGKKPAMFYYAASSGVYNYEVSARFPDLVLEHSERISPGDPHLTGRMPGRVLDRENLFADILQRNYENSARDAAIAAHYMKDAQVNSPNHRETFLRALNEIYPITFGVTYEDIIFEIHKWGPFLLHDMRLGIHGRDHAWSINAVPEEQLADAIQFGMALPLEIRRGMQFDVVDIQGRPVSLLDRAWERSRNILDVTTWEAGGHTFRNDFAVAHLATLFMYDEFYRSRSYKEMDRTYAHPVIREHYRDTNAKQSFQFLKEHMAPYMATYCNTPTLYKILEQDLALSDYWHNVIMPTAPQVRPLHEIIPPILSHVPRGGFNDERLRQKAQRFTENPEQKIILSFRDAATNDNDTPPPKLPPMPLGLRGKHSFDECWDPKMFDDRNLAQLGGTSDPDKTPDPNQYNTYQSAALKIVSSMRETGLRPANAPRKWLYLDDPQNGIRAAHARFNEEQIVRDSRELGGVFDTLAEGGKTYGFKHAPDAARDFEQQRLALLADPRFEDWRKANGFGNGMGLSDIVAQAQVQEGIREALGTDKYYSTAAAGPMRNPGDVVETAARRLIDMELNGLIIPAGNLQPMSWRLAGEALTAAIGQTERDYEGGQFDMGFFLDHDYYKPLDHREAPQQMDMADMMIHLGLMTKYLLEQKDVILARDEFVTMARFTDIYEKIIDPGRRNQEIVTERRTGQPHRNTVIDLGQIDPFFKKFAQHDPGLVGDMIDYSAAAYGKNPVYDSVVNNADYQRFYNNDISREELAEWVSDPVQKSTLANMIWFYMRAQKIPGHEQSPVSGMMLLRGIHAFNQRDLRDLHPEYSDAFDARETLKAFRRMNIFEAGQRHVKGPSVVVPKR